MIISTLAASVMTLALQQASPADARNNPDETSAAREESEGERMVCRRERIVGSNFPERVCLPAKEWDRIRDEAREERRRVNERGHRFNEPLGSPAGS